MINKQSTRQQSWNQRYRDKAAIAPQLPEQLKPVLKSLKPGLTLDLACGDGAAALALARSGHQVTAVDFAMEGLSRLQGFAKKEALEITTQCIDLSDSEALSGLGVFDNIVIVRYMPETELLETMADQLKPGGRLIIATFNMSHHHETGFPVRLCLQPQQFESLAGLRLESYSNGLVGDSAIDIYCFVAYNTVQEC